MLHFHWSSQVLLPIVEIWSEKFDPKHLQALHLPLSATLQTKKGGASPAVLCILHSASHFSIPLRPHPSCRSLARGSLGAEIVFRTPCPSDCPTVLWSLPRGGSTLELIESTHLYIFATQLQDPYKTGFLIQENCSRKPLPRGCRCSVPAQFCTVSNCWCLAVKTSKKFLKNLLWL